MSLLLWALAWDLLLGEPPVPLHPVVWMGNAISLAKRWMPEIKEPAFITPTPALPPQGGGGNARQFTWGMILTFALVGASALVGFLPNYLPAPWGWGLAVFLLTSSFSLRELLRSAERIGAELAREDIESARTQLSMIVSRSVEGLDEPRIAAAALQSVSENLTDSVIAPLFYFALFGLPGALAYRAANTLDAMLGYRGKYEYLGKFPARLDDALNFVPARITAFLLLVLGRGDRHAWAVWRRDCRKPASPNGGHPMAAAAGLLGVTLEKVDHYRLGDGRLPEGGDIPRLNRLALSISVLSVLLLTLVVR